MGESVDGYGNELWVIKGGEKKEKSISRSMVELTLLNVLRIMKTVGRVSGPKKPNIPGTGSFLYAIFLNWGVIWREQQIYLQMCINQRETEQLIMWCKWVAIARDCGSLYDPWIGGRLR